MKWLTGSLRRPRSKNNTGSETSKPVGRQMSSTQQDDHIKRVHTKSAASISVVEAKYRLRHPLMLRQARW